MYTKLFSSIVHSTIWREDSDTCKVWVTMLALVDKNGCVWASVPGLADVARVDIEICRAALVKFMAPDHDSRSKVSEGRRIEEIDGGWWLINHEKFDKIKNMDERREQVAAAVRRHRAKSNGSDVIIGNQSNHEKSDVSPSAQTQAHADSSSGETLEEIELAAKLPTDHDRVALTALLVHVPNRAAYLAEMSVALEGMHGPPLTPQQLGEALRDYVGNGDHEQPNFKHFRAYLRRPDQVRRRVGRSIEAGALAVDPGSILAAIKKLATSHPTQGSGIVHRIARQEVAKLGERVLAAFDAVGGAESILGANGQSWGFLVRDFGKALHG